MTWEPEYGYVVDGCEEYRIDWRLKLAVVVLSIAGGAAIFGMIYGVLRLLGVL